MSTTQWVITAIFALLGGGAMGAVINNWAINRRNKRQPILYGTRTTNIIRKHQNFPSLRAVLTIGEDSGPGRAVDNLSLATVRLGNKGNQDLDRFDFGVTLQGTDKAIDVKFENPDRHHKVELLTPVSVLEPKQEIDFSLRPFNRGDVYDVSILFIYERFSEGLKVSTPHPQRLVEVSPWDITPTKLDIIGKWFFRVFLFITSLIMLFVLYKILTGPSDGALPIPIA